MKPVRFHRYTTVISLVFLTTTMIFFQNCGEVHFSSINPAALSKGIAVSAFQAVSKKDSKSQLLFETKVSGSGDSLKIEKNSPFIVTYNNKCLQDNTTNRSKLSRPIVQKSSAARSLTKLTQVNKDLSLKELDEMAKEDPCIDLIAPNLKYKLSGLPNDSLYNRQTYLQNIKFNNTAPSNSLDFFANGIQNDVVVAVLDDGIELNHPDLRSNILLSKQFAFRTRLEVNEQGELTGALILEATNDAKTAARDCLPGSNYLLPVGYPLASGDFIAREALCEFNRNANYSINFAHGTFVAGQIAAVANNSIGVVGMGNNKIKIMPIKVFQPILDVDEEGRVLDIFASGDTISVIEGIYYAIENGANVINLSLATSDPDLALRNAIIDAVSSNVSVFIAAGNEDCEFVVDAQSGELVCKITGTNSQSPFLYPAVDGFDIPGAVTVGAISVEGNQRCDFSNYSKDFVELAAPGCQQAQRDSNGVHIGLLSTGFSALTIGGFTFPEYEDFQSVGTSFSAPLASGAAALIYGYHRDTKSKTLSPEEIETILMTHSRKEASVQEHFIGGSSLDLDKVVEAIKPAITFDEWVVTQPAACTTACGQVASTQTGSVTCPTNNCDSNKKPATPTRSCSATPACPPEVSNLSFTIEGSANFTEGSVASGRGFADLSVSYAGDAKPDAFNLALKISPHLAPDCPAKVIEIANQLGATEELRQAYLGACKANPHEGSVYFAAENRAQTINLQIPANSRSASIRVFSPEDSRLEYNRGYKVEITSATAVTNTSKYSIASLGNGITGVVKDRVNNPNFFVRLISTSYIYETDSIFAGQPGDLNKGAFFVEYSGAGQDVIFEVEIEKVANANGRAEATEGLDYVLSEPNIKFVLAYNWKSINTLAVTGVTDSNNEPDECFSYRVKRVSISGYNGEGELPANKTGPFSNVISMCITNGTYQ